MVLNPMMGLMAIQAGRAIGKTIQDWDLESCRHFGRVVLGLGVLSTLSTSLIFGAGVLVYQHYNPSPQTLVEKIEQPKPYMRVRYIPGEDRTGIDYIDRQR